MSRQSLWFRVWYVCLALAWALFPSAMGFAAPRGQAGMQSPGIMLAAVSRDDAVLSGGISTGIRTPDGIADVEPIAWLTPSGAWQDLPCNYHWLTDADISRCRQFASAYLSQSHQYAVVSADGYGATIHAPPSSLNDCYAFAARGVYSGPSILRTTLAASDPAAFLSSPPLKPVEGIAYTQVLTAFAAASPVHLNTLAGIRLYQVHWGGRSLIVVERYFTDFASASPSVVPDVKLVFAIGQIVQRRFHILFWKDNTEDENEQVLGTLLLRTGQQFLVTSINSPEAQFFRIYAMQNGSIRMVFSGGGSSC